MHVVLNITLVAASLIFMILIAIKSKKHAKSQEARNRKLLDEEDAARFVRKKDLDADLFFEADLSSLPNITDDDPHQVLRAAKRKMIRFETPVSNLSLKMQYGPAQIDIIAQYEENFNDFLRALTNWAEALHEDGKTRDAIRVLEYAIVLGSQYRSTYKLAADIYASLHDTSSLTALHENAQKNHFADPAMQQSVLNYIANKQ